MAALSLLYARHLLQEGPEMYSRACAEQMTAVGFEPTRIAPPELESGALDRSAKLSSCVEGGAIHFHTFTRSHYVASAVNLRFPGIEPGPSAWKADTLTPQAFS